MAALAPFTVACQPGASCTFSRMPVAPAVLMRQASALTEVAVDAGTPRAAGRVESTAPARKAASGADPVLSRWYGRLSPSHSTLPRPRAPRTTTSLPPVARTGRPHDCRRLAVCVDHPPEFAY